jgi:hypothetical protein
MALKSLVDLGFGEFFKFTVCLLEQITCYRINKWHLWDARLQAYSSVHVHQMQSDTPHHEDSPHRDAHTLSKHWQQYLFGPSGKLMNSIVWSLLHSYRFYIESKAVIIILKMVKVVLKENFSKR